MDDRKRYDTLCAKIRVIIGRGAQRDWCLGAALNEMRDSDLWKQVSRSKGRAYFGFYSFAFGEFKLGRSEVMRCCRVAATFTKNQVAGWDSYGINLVANIKDAKLREKLLRDYPAGVSGRGSRLEKVIRALPHAKVFKPLMRNAVRGGSMNALADLTELMRNKPGFSVRIEQKRSHIGADLVGFRCKASLLSKRGIEAIGEDYTAPTAVRNMLIAFYEKPKRKAAA